jgi:hypothetical protein
MRDTRPIQAISCGGNRNTGYTAAPWWGFGLGFPAPDYDRVFDVLLRQYLQRPGTRYMVLNPLGDYNEGRYQAFSPFMAKDVLGWVRRAHVDALALARKLRPGCKFGLHLGLMGNDPDHHVATRTLTPADKPWVVESLQQWDRAGFNGEFSLDTSSMSENAALSEAIASWIAPSVEICLEGIPFISNDVIDAARLTKHPAIGLDNNLWVQGLATNKIVAPLIYQGRPCREAVIIFCHSAMGPDGKPTEQTRALMRLLRQRNFGLGGDDRFDQMIGEVMAEYPAR